MKYPGNALFVLVATIACRGGDVAQPTAPRPVAHAPAIVGLQTYLEGSVTSTVDFFLMDLDGDQITWRASVMTAPGCRCTAGSLGPTAGTVSSGTRIRLRYVPGGSSVPNNVNNVLVTIEASDPAGNGTRAAIEVANW